MAENKNVGKKFILHGGILAIAGIVVRIIGMVYRIPLLNIIGSEGNGIYSVAFNIYNIALIVSCYGLPMAVSKLISARIVKAQYKNAYELFKLALLVAFITGTISMLLMFFFADFLENVVYAGSYPMVSVPIKVLAPTVLVVAILGVVRGFFQGHGTMIPTALSQLFEQIVNAIVSVVAGYLLVVAYKSSVNVAAYGAAGGTLGTFAGALTALVFVVSLYLIKRREFIVRVRNDENTENESFSMLLKILACTVIPIMIGQTFYQISASLDDIMYANIMKNLGLTAQQIARNNGNYNSSYMILINLPMGVASAMSSSMLPSVVASFAKKNISEINNKIAATVKVNMMIAIPSFVGLFVLGGPVIRLLFPSYDYLQGSIMLKIGAIAVVFYTMSTVTGSALQGIDRMNSPVKHSCVALIAHIILLWVLLRYTDLSIYAMVIGSASFPVLIFILNMIELHKLIGYKQEILKTYIVPLICSVLMGGVTFFTYNIIYKYTGSNIISICPALLIAVIVYFGCLFLFRKKGAY